MSMKKTERQTRRPNGSANPPKARKTTEKKVIIDAVDTIAEGTSGENLSLTEIKELIELVSEKQFSEFELERGDFRLRLQRGGARVVAEVPVVPVTTATGSAPVAAATVVHQPEAKPAAEPSADEKLHLVTSPIVGTFYRSPSPTAESFVKLGDAIEAGKTLCIIEAMKLMNEIQSDATGTVAKIFVENGQPVEYGQPLFGLKV
jgi:acetyl-CoA carboxylase biotin carboxyl carrier protein